MNKLLAISVAAVLVLVLLIFSTSYTVSFNEVAILQTFGRSSPESVKTDAGLKLKWPIFQDKDKFDRRLQILESPLEEIMLTDGQQVVARAFLMWRINTEDPSRTVAFANAYESIAEAESSLRNTFVTAVAGTLSGYAFNDLLGTDNRLAEAEDRIKASLVTALEPTGVVPVTVGISQLLLPEKASNSVIKRMEATRERLAEALRQQGTAEAEGIASKATTEAEKIRAFANQRAAEIQSQSQAQAVRYMELMADEEGLAIFLVWLDALEAALSEHVTVVLDAEEAPMHLMRLTSQRDENGIPQPTEPRMAGVEDGGGVGPDGANDERQ